MLGNCGYRKKKVLERGEKCFLRWQIKRIFTARPWSILPLGDAVIGVSRKM